MSKKRHYTEQEIVAGCSDNQRFFQEQLYRVFFPAMLRMCMRYTDDREVAMHIINTGFLRVFKKIHTFSFQGSLEGWIRKLVYHSVSDYFRNNSRSLHFLVFEERDQQVQEQATSNMFLDDILGMMEKLPPATKEVFRLYAIEGYTHVEIAKQLKISSGTSKWHLSAARKQLKQLIEHYNRPHLKVKG